MSKYITKSENFTKTFREFLLSLLFNFAILLDGIIGVLSLSFLTGHFAINAIKLEVRFRAKYLKESSESFIDFLENEF